MLGASGTVADFFERAFADQVGSHAPERDRRAHAAFIERVAFRHPDQEPADDLQGASGSPGTSGPGTKRTSTMPSASPEIS